MDQPPPGEPCPLIRRRRVRDSDRGVHRTMAISDWRERLAAPRRCGFGEVPASIRIVPHRRDLAVVPANGRYFSADDELRPPYLAVRNDRLQLPLPCQRHRRDGWRRIDRGSACRAAWIPPDKRVGCPHQSHHSYRGFLPRGLFPSNTEPTARQVARIEESELVAGNRRWISVVLFTTGFASLAMEVAWVRPSHF